MGSNFHLLCTYIGTGESLFIVKCKHPHLENLPFSQNIISQLTPFFSETREELDSVENHILSIEHNSCMNEYIDMSNFLMMFLLLS